MTDSNIASDPLLLTPGPLTTSASVKRAMLHDLGSRDKTFIDLTERIRLRLTSIAQVEDTHVCIPLQGSGTFVVEAMMSALADKPVAHVRPGTEGRDTTTDLGAVAAALQAPPHQARPVRRCSCPQHWPQV